MAERIAVADLGSNSFRLVVFTAGRRLVEAHRRDLRGRAHRRGPGRDRRARRGGDGARAGDDGGLRPLLRGRGIEPGEVLAVATSAIRDAHELRGLPRARPGGQRPARARAQRRGGGALRLPGRRQLDDAGRRRHARHRRRLDAARARRRPPRARARLLAPGRGAHDRALPARRRPGQAQAGPRARGLRQGQARARAVAGRAGTRLVGIGGTIRNLAAAAQRDLEVPESGVQGYVITRDELDRLVDQLASRSAGRARQVPGHQALARRHHPRRRDRRADGAGGRRLRRPRGHRGGPARGRLLRAPPRRRPAAVRRRAPRERRQPRRPVRAWTPSATRTSPTSRSSRSGSSTSWRRPASTPATRSSASCCGPRRCCTTSA